MFRYCALFRVLYQAKNVSNGINGNINCHKNANPLLVRYHFGYRSAFLIPHTKKALKGGEDSFFLDKGGICVVDGVGGWAAHGVDPSVYPRLVMKHAHQAMLKANSGLDSGDRGNINGGLSNRYEYRIDPHKAIEAGMKAAERCQGSCTLMAVFIKEIKEDITKNKENQVGGENSIKKDQESDFVNNAQNHCDIVKVTTKACSLLIGDCGMVIIRDGSLLYRTEEQQSSFNCPFQIPSNSLEDGVKNEHELCQNDLYVLGSDGVFDNVYDGAIVDLINKLTPKETNGIHTSESCAMVAKELAEMAFKNSTNRKFYSPFTMRAMKMGINDIGGGKEDDITVVVGVITHEKIDVKPPFSTFQEVKFINGRSAP